MNTINRVTCIKTFKLKFCAACMKRVVLSSHKTEPRPAKPNKTRRKLNKDELKYSREKAICNGSFFLFNILDMEFFSRKGFNQFIFLFYSNKINVIWLWKMWRSEKKTNKVFDVEKENGQQMSKKKDKLQVVLYKMDEQTIDSIRFGFAALAAIQQKLNIITNWLEYNARMVGVFNRVIC